MKLFENGRKYTADEVREILKTHGRKIADLWPNVWGWSLYYTTEPTTATPCGGRRRIYADGRQNRAPLFR